MPKCHAFVKCKETVLTSASLNRFSQIKTQRNRLTSASLNRFSQIKPKEPGKGVLLCCEWWCNYSGRTLLRTDKYNECLDV